MRALALCALVLTVSGCVSVDPYRCGTLSNYCSPEARIERPTLTDLVNLPTPRQKAVVSVYSFADQTGQRATADNMALFSTAVTQGADSFLIDALMAAGSGKWFLVAERANLDVLTRERQLIISTRNNYDGEGANQLEPLLFSGLILAGGIIGYDTNLLSGGAGARYLQIYSTATNFDTFIFTETGGTELVEIEAGAARNETATYAVRSAIEAAVLELVHQGIEQDMWDYIPQEVQNEITD